MTIKWGILGAGWIADKFVSDFSLVNNGEVVAIAARSELRAQEFAKTHNISMAYGSYLDLVNDKSIDIIYVATTHNFHFEHSKLCLENGKAVLCEKPATVNAKEFNELCSIARANNLFYMEAMWTPFLPTIMQAIEWVKSGEIGEIGSINANFGFPAAPEFSERLFNPNLAGGALLDVGIYPLTIIELFANSEIKKIDINETMTSKGVDETLAIQLRYKNGISAQMTCSIKNRLMNHAFICGSKGFIQIPDFWMSKKAILTVGDEITEFVDDTTTMGYNCEAEAIGKNLIANKIENETMPLAKTKKMMELMDDIRDKIGLKYPFE